MMVEADVGCKNSRRHVATVESSVAADSFVVALQPQSFVAALQPNNHRYMLT